MNVSGVAPGETAQIRLKSIIGPPEDVRSRVFAAIGREARTQDLALLIGGDSDLDYTITGYMTGASGDGRTEYAYVFDVIGPDSRRAHRVAGVIPAKSDKTEPWKSLDRGLIRDIARIVVADLKAWYETVRPPDPPPESETRPATSGSPPPPTNTPLTPDALFAPAGSPAQTGLPGTVFDEPATEIVMRPITMALGPIEGAPGDGSQALAKAIRASLRDYGIILSDTSVPGGYRLTAEISVTPPQKSRQLVAIIWAVNRADAPVGTVRQVNTVPIGQVTGNWSQMAGPAVEAAANGIAALVQPNPVK